MKEYRLSCAACAAGFTADSIEPGNMPSCPECGGELLLSDAVSWRCEKCGESVALPGGQKLNAPPVCQNCGAPTYPDPEQTEGAKAPAVDAPIDDTIQLAPMKPEIARPTVPAKPAATGEGKSDDASIPLVGAHKAPAPPPPKTPPSGDKTEYDRTLKLDLDATVREVSSDEETAEPSDRTLAMAQTAVTPATERGKAIGASGGIKDTTFGRYQVLSEIARGGMGIVYKVYDPELRRDLALKVLIEGEGASEDTIKRFMREARAAANLRHPNIITVHEMGQIDGQYYFTMEYVEGCSFQSIISLRGKESIDPKLFVRYMIDVCLALDTAHESGIYHRDLKPGNILLDTKNDKVVLMDFGLAKDNSSMSIQSMTGSVFGSPAYMSPEQAQGRTHEIDHRSDIYSMGVILYEGLTKIQPFRGETVFDTITQVVHAEPVRPRTIAPYSVDKDIENIILKCMEKNADKRYPSMAALAADLRAYLDDRPVSARPIPAYVRGWRKIRRRPAALGSLIAVPLGIIALIVGWLIFSRPSYVELAEKALREGDADRKLGAVLELTSQLKEGKIEKEEERAKAFSLLRGTVGAEDPKVVRAAMGSLADLRDVTAIGELAALAFNPKVDKPSRLGALTALTTIAGGENPKNNALTESLLKLAENNNEPLDIRSAAIAASSAAWTPAGIPFAIELAKNDKAPSVLRVGALNALKGRLPLESPRVTELIPLCGNRDEAVAKAADALIRSLRTTDSLFSFYGMKDIAANAVRQAGQVVAMANEYNDKLQAMMDDMDKPSRKPAEPAPSPWEVVAGKFKDANPDIRMTVAYDLGTLDDPKAVPALTAALTDPANAVKTVAAKSLLKLAPKAKPDMKQIRELTRHADPMTREQAVFLIDKLADKASLDTLLEVAGTEENRRVIAALAGALARFGDPRAIPVLSGAKDRVEGENPAAALALVRAMAAFGEKAVPELIAFLDDPRTPIRESATKELEEITGENFGPDIEKWKKWAAAKPKIETL